MVGLDRGHDVEGQEMVTQGFTHVFSMTFDDKEAIASFLTHPKHLEFCPTFSAAIEKIIVLDFPSLLLKPPALPPPSPEAVPPSVMASTPLPPPPPPPVSAPAPPPTPASAPA